MEPQQEIFTKLKIEIEKLGYNVYDGKLPPKGTKYPFVYLGNSTQNDVIPFKNGLYANVTQVIHIWSNNVQRRGDVSKMLLDAKKVAYQLVETKTYYWRVDSVNQNILSDGTTEEPLLHGYIDFEFKMTGLK